jgi:hypothetical protein
VQNTRLKRLGFYLAVGLMAALLLSACRPLHNAQWFEHPPKIGSNPRVEVTLAPTYTPTAEPVAVVQPTETPTTAPTAIPTATPTEVAASAPVAAQPAATATATATRPPATATARTASAKPTVTPTARPTPIVVIPNGFTVQTDSTRGYSLALPRGYTPLDLRSAQFRNLAGAIGMGDRMASLNEFLDSPAGQSVGMLAASDLAGMIFGGLPTIAQVMVVDAKGASQDTAQVSINSLLTGQGGFLSNPVIEKMENVTINNLPGVRATVTGTMAGANRAMAGKVVGLLANDKFFVLIQLTEAAKLAAKEPIFDQIIGTFRPE